MSLHCRRHLHTEKRLKSHWQTGGCWSSLSSNNTHNIYLLVHMEYLFFFSQQCRFSSCKSASISNWGWDVFDESVFLTWGQRCPITDLWLDPNHVPVQKMSIDYAVRWARSVIWCAGKWSRVRPAPGQKRADAASGQTWRQRKEL